MEFAAQDDGKQVTVLGADGSQRAITSGSFYRLTDRIEKAVGGLGVTHHRQSVQVTGVGDAFCLS